MKSQPSRLEQIGALARAAASVALTGKCELIASAESGQPKVASLLTYAEHQAAAAKGRAYYGIYSEVARELGTWPSHVRRVFLGHATSARVTKAITAALDRRAEMARVDAELASKTGGAKK